MIPRAWWRRVALAGLALGGVVLGSCAPELAGWQDPAGVDRTPPVLLAVAPDGQDVEPATCFELVFSEALDPASLTPAGPAGLDGALLLTGAADPATVALAGDGALSADAAHLPVDAALDLAAAGTTLSLCPRAVLAEETPFTLVATRRLCDRAGNPLARALDDPGTGDVSVTLETTFAGLRVTAVEPPDGATEVPPNLAAIVVTFARPVRASSVTGDAVEVRAGDAPVPLAQHVLAPDGLQLSLELPAGQDLALATTHEVRLGTALRSVERDRALVAPFRSQFVTAAELDDRPPGFTATPDVVPEDVLARLSFQTDEPARPEVACTSGDGAGALELTPTELQSAWELALAPLEPESEYACTLEVADAVGNLAPAVELGFRTTAPQGRPVITEVLANPLGGADEEHGREYVELYNAGGASVDLATFRLDDKGDASGADALVGSEDAGTELAPGQYALVVSTAYDGTLALPPGTLLLVADDSRLGSDGLAQADSVELYDGEPDAGARAVSTYGGWHKASTDGAAVERCDPAAPDEAECWRLRDAGGTPGAPCEGE